MNYWIFILNPRPTVLGMPNEEGAGRHRWANLLEDTRCKGEARWNWSHDPASIRTLESTKRGDGIVVYQAVGWPQVMGFAETTSDWHWNEADNRRSYVKIRATARALHRVGPEVLEQFQKGGPSHQNVVQISEEDWYYLENLVGRRELED